MDDSHTISGHQLLLLLRFLGKGVATPPLRIHQGVLQGRDRIEHPYGAIAWFGQMAIRATQRKLLEESKPAARQDMHFHIEIAADEIVAATNGPEVWGGLSDNDKDQLSELLVRFMRLVANGEIPEHDLTR